MINFNEYQQKVSRTAVYNNPGNNLDYVTEGLVEEAGEFAGKVKRIHRNEPFNRVKAAQELGDTLWYLAEAAKTLSFSLETIAMMNLSKQLSRLRRGKIKGEGDLR